MEAIIGFVFGGFFGAIITFLILTRKAKLAVEPTDTSSGPVGTGGDGKDLKNPE